VKNLTTNLEHASICNRIAREVMTSRFGDRACHGREVRERSSTAVRISATVSASEGYTRSRIPTERTRADHADGATSVFRCTSALSSKSKREM
jgi:hypothetical protein